MVRILKDVKRIVLHPTTASLMAENKFRSVPLNDWNIYIGDVEQIQNQADVHNKTVMFMEDEVSCRVYQDEREVYCSSEPRDLENNILQDIPVRK